MAKKFLPDGSRGKQWVRETFLAPKVPGHLAANHLTVSEAGLSEIGNSLKKNFFSWEPEGYLSTEVGQADFHDHVKGRLEEDRRYRIPWLDSVLPLKNARILEIGCGTGASTIALAEQGAEVVAADIDERALVDARKRAEVYGLEIAFHNLNAAAVADHFAGQSFDLIVFWACIEHMTLEERKVAMKNTWRMLPQGSYWCVTDTPNRLHFFDAHTANLPFYFWLPDELALDYAPYSPREKLRETFAGKPRNEETMELFYRWGRGLSYHEFEMTMGNLDQLKIEDSLMTFHRRQRLLFGLKSRFSTNYRYETLMHKRFPNIPRGFFQPNLDLMIQKT